MCPVKDKDRVYSDKVSLIVVKITVITEKAHGFFLQC